RSHRAKCGGRRCVGSDPERWGERGTLEERKECLILRFANAAIAEGPDDADDFDVGFRIGPVAQPETRANRVAVAEVTASQALVDNCRAEPGRPLAAPPQPRIVFDVAEVTARE